MSRYWKCLILVLIVMIVGGMGTYGVKTYYFRQEPDKPFPIKVVEAQRSPLALPHYVAIAQGFYREQNLALESNVSATHPESQWTLEEKGDIVLCNLSQSLFTQPMGTDARLVAFAGLAKKDGTFLLGREQQQDFTWDKLKRRSILGDAPDDQSNIILEEALKNNKLTLQQQVIIIQNIPLKLKEGAFQAGVGHYVQMSEPMATKIEMNGEGWVVAATGDAVGPIPALVLSAPPVYLKKHGREIQKLANGLCKGMLWLDYHSTAEAAAVVEPYFPDIERQSLIKIIERYKKLGIWDKSPVIAKEDYENLKDYVQRAGELTNQVAYKNGVNNRFAHKAANTIKYIPPELQKEKTLWEKVKTLDFK